MIAAKVANALALDWPRERLEVIVAVDGGAEPGADAHGRARARGRRRRRARAAARRQDARPGRRRCAPRRGELLAFSDANALWEPGALRALAAAVRGPARRLRLRAGRASSTRRGTNQEGLYWRYEMWLRARESALALGDGRQRRDLRRAPRGLPRGRPARWATTSRSRSRWSSAAGAPSTSRSARATEKMVPTIEGEWARKRRMMTHAWPIVLRGGLLDPRGYPPLYALMIALAPAAALRDAVPARRRARWPALALRRARPRTRPRRSPSSALLARRRGRRPRARAAAAARPLLRAHDRVDRRRPATTTCATARRRAGSRRRARGEPWLDSRRGARCDLARRAASALRR